MRLLSSFAIAGALAAGCGSVVIEPMGGTTSGGGAGGATVAHATATGFGGAGGSIVTATASTHVATFTSTGTGGSPTCDPATTFVRIVGDGPTQIIDGSCKPSGHRIVNSGPKPPPPPGPMDFIYISACTTSTAAKLTLTGGPASWPTAISDAYLTYERDDGGAYFTEMPAGSAELTITTFEDVGGVIEGSFEATVTIAGAPVMLSGNFRVCRTDDVWPV